MNFLDILKEFGKLFHWPDLDHPKKKNLFSCLHTKQLYLIPHQKILQTNNLLAESHLHKIYKKKDRYDNHKKNVKNLFVCIALFL